MKKPKLYTVRYDEEHSLWALMIGGEAVLWAGAPIKFRPFLGNDRYVIDHDQWDKPSKQ